MIERDKERAYPGVIELGQVSSEDCSERVQSVVGAGEIWLQGRAIVPGIAFGSLFMFPEGVSPERKEPLSEPIFVDSEVARLVRAVEKSQEELKALIQKLLSEGFVQEAEVIESHLEMTSDFGLIGEVEKTIRQGQKSADCALEELVQRFRCQFDTIPDLRLRQRFEDVESVCLRILSFLSPGQSESLTIPAQAILFARTVTAPVVAEVSVRGVGAIVTSQGGAMSHTAIVAKARGIPYVTDIHLRDSVGDGVGVFAIVDGLTGFIVIRPAPETVQRYAALKEAHESHWREDLSPFAVPPRAETKDHVPISLFANVAGVTDVRQISTYALDGVGLYRTEYQVLERKRFPSESEQSAVYAEMVKAAGGKPVVIRVFDFGSDKGWEELSGAIPNLEPGVRSIPLLLDHPHIFFAHLRSIVRAAELGPLSVLFPMVSTVHELDQCLDVLRQAQRMVSAESSHLRVGVMIEVPSIAFQIASLRGRVDFVSIGTNDLIQYSLAVDRSNNASFDPRLSYHPGLLRLLHCIVQDSREAGLPLCLCGEMASDPLLIAFLVGLGISQLSLVPRLAPMVRHVLKSYTYQEAQEIAERTLSLPSVEEVYSFLRTKYCMIGGNSP